MGHKELVSARGSDGGGVVRHHSSRSRVLVAVAIAAAIAAASISLVLPGCGVGTEPERIVSSSTAARESVGEPVSAKDAEAKSLVRNAMVALESVFIDLETFDPAVATPDIMGAMEPAITFVVSPGGDAAVAPSALAEDNAVDYWGTATTYAIGTISASGTTFGVMVDQEAGRRMTFYVDGVAKDWQSEDSAPVAGDEPSNPGIGSYSGRLASAGVPTARSRHDMVYDPVSGTIILYGGGIGSNGGRDTWVYDPNANTWTELIPAGKVPSVPDGHAMVWDEAGRRVILFGGFDTEAWSSVDDTWAYDPPANAWTQLHPLGISPCPRSHHAMVYDPVGRKVILLGGLDDQEGRMLNDTWAYDPASNVWTELRPSGGPPSGRAGHKMVYDPIDNKVLLFGGSGSGACPLNDMWSYDPSADSWTQLHPTGDLPSAREDPGLTYDPISRRVILFGGKGDPEWFSDTWAYDPAAKAWSKLDTAGTPPTRSQFAMVYAANIGRILAFGGWTDSGPGYLNDTWAYDPAGNTWTDLEPLGPVSDTPAARAYHCMVYNEPTGNIVLFGGAGDDGSVNDTWSYDPRANTWTEMYPNTLNGSPSPDSPWGSFGPTMVYDPGSKQAILFGGRFGDDTWSYDEAANTWTPLHTSGVLPDPRFAYGVVYDAAHHRSILYGGWADESPGDFTNPWAYDPEANAWAELRPNGSPGPLLVLMPSMVYDPIGRTVLVLGGLMDGSGPVPARQTWVFDPADMSWTKLDIDGDAPCPREGEAVVYDPVGRRVILFGGMDENGEALNDTWAYDPAGNTWTRLATTGDAPPGRVFHAMAYDSAARQLILFGGGGPDVVLTTGSSFFDDTWAYDPAANTWTNLHPQGGNSQ